MNSRFGEDAAIKVGSSGQFDVVVDGRVIFSKSQAGRFPNDGEVEERLAALRAGKELPPIEAQAGVLRRMVGKLLG